MWREPALTPKSATRFRAHGVQSESQEIISLQTRKTNGLTQIKAADWAPGH